jgi:homoserine dehydrogenase
MTEKSVPFEEALEDAKRLGYAESDPTFDTGGIDAAHKITILANLAFGTPVDFESVYTEGIEMLLPDDFDFAKQFGRVIKLLATARIDSGRVDVRVHPAMVPEHRPIARIDGVTNAVELDVAGSGRLMLIGAGAGGDATSTAVVADMVDIARNMLSGSIGRVSPFAFRREARRKLPMKPIEEITSGYYLRFSVYDRPGVLAAMAGILGKHGISIESVIQKGRSHGPVPLVILTHEAREKELRKAVKELDKLETTRDKTRIIRLEDGDGHNMPQQ